MGSSSPNAGLPLMPRVLGIAVGGLMVPVAVFIALGGLVFLLDRSHPYLGPFLGLVCIIAVAWLLSLAWRLILNRPRRSTGGLLSPLALRIIGTVMILAPLAAVAGSLFAQTPERWWRVIQVCIYFVVGVRLFQLAAARSKLLPENSGDDQHASGA